MSQVMRRGIVSLFILTALGATAAWAQDGAQASRAQQVLSQARAAIGGEAKLKAIQSLSVVWKVRRLAGGNQQDTGEIRVDLLLPDKFLRSEAIDISGNIGQVTSMASLNGDEITSDARSTNPEIPVVNAGAGSESEQAALRQKLRKEYAYQLLQLTLTPPPFAPIEFSYVGEAEAEDGRADVLEAKGPNDFLVRLFFDKRTHHLLLASYREAARGPLKMPGHKTDKGSVKPAQAAQSNTFRPPDVEVLLRYSDYRAKDGIFVPHRITRERDGQLNEELDLKSIKFNPPLKPEHFGATRKR